MQSSNIPPSRLLRWLILLLIQVGLNVSHAEYTCDESKCRGERIHPWVDDDTEFTCWVKTPTFSPTANATQVVEAMAEFEDSLMDPRSGYCADGYIGRLVSEVPQAEVDGEMRSWYTCCPPDAGYDSLSKQVYQTCSDTACSSPDWAGGGNCWADGFQEPMSCGDTVYRYPRYTGLQSLIYVQFVCCDSPQKDDDFMDELLIARIIWVTLSCISVVVCSVFIIALSRDKEARSNGYNLYLIFLAIPDALANIMIILRNALAISGVPVSPTIFIFVASFEYFYAISNIYLNAIIVSVIWRILRRSNKDKNKGQQQIPPPSVQKVCKETIIVYSFALIVFGWAFFLYIHGLNTFSLGQIMNVWITTRCLLVGPPILYVIYVCFDVWWFERLPISGRTRVLSLYFLRVIIIFLLTWVPYFVLYEIAWNITHNKWMVFVSYYLGSVQGALSVMVALSKPDVKKVFWDFIYCSSSTDLQASSQDAKKRRRRRHREESNSDAYTNTVEHESTFDDELDDVPGPLPTRRLFGGSTKADKLWEEDDVWGGEDDVLEKIMAGAEEGRPEFYAPSSGTAPSRQNTVTDLEGSVWSDEEPKDEDASTDRDNVEAIPVPPPSEELSAESQTHPDATVLYCEIVGFDTLSSELPAAKVADLTKRLHAKFDELADKHKVTKVNALGGKALGGKAWMGATNCVEDQPDDHTLRLAQFGIDAILAAGATPVDEDDPDKGYVSVQGAMMSGEVQGRAGSSSYSLDGPIVGAVAYLAAQKSEVGRIICTEREQIVLEQNAPDLPVSIKSRVFIPGMGATLAFWVSPPVQRHASELSAESLSV